MRPLKLTITAFGPYATQQIIDFSELKGRNLFVITGDTGAGKTTILDGISYALYGKASGRDRDGESLRSHFASGNLLTCVELEFELRGERYWVKRIPKQRKKRTRGEGYTDQNAEAEFKKLDGESNLLTGFKDVSEKISDLMGLSYEQFKQIIMIPQGEFRELLNADSKVRQEILQKIFGTEGFRRIQELFDGQAKGLHQEIGQIANQRNEWIRSLDSSGYEPLAVALEPSDVNVSLVMSEVKQAIEMDENHGKNMQNQVDEYEQKIRMKQEEIFQGKGNNHKFIVRDEALTQKIKLEACQSQFDEKKRTLHQGRKTLEIARASEYRSLRADYVAKKQIELSEIAEEEKKAEVAAKAAEEAYYLENAKEQQRAELLAEQSRLEGFLSKTTDWEVQQTRVTQLEKDLRAVQNSRDQGKKQVEKARSEVEECQKRLDQGRVATAEYALKSVETKKAEAVYHRFKNLQEECKNLLAIETSIVLLREEAKKQQVQYEKTQVDYEEAQQLFFQGQAGILAAKLQTGELCPVCGSDHHPKLAVIIGNSPTEHELQILVKHNKKSRELYEEVKGRYERSSADHHAQSQIVLRLQKELSEEVAHALDKFDVTQLLAYIGEKLPEYQSCYEQLQVELRAIALRKNDEQELATQLMEKNEAVSRLSLVLESVEGQYMELFAQVQSAKDAMKSLEAQLPAEEWSVASLSEKLERVVRQYGLMKQALEQAKEESRNRQLSYAIAVAEKSSAEKVLQEGQAELVIAKDDFMKALLTAGFTDEVEYEKAKLTEGEIVDLEKEINDFHEKLRSARDYYLQMEHEVESLTLVDVMALEAEFLALQQEKNQLITERTALMTRYIHNKTMYKKIATLANQLEEKEDDYLLIGHLARVAKGDNEQKISFERYVLAAFFNDIIEAGNGRLSKMTGGRYQMSRISQKGKGSGQSGLEIEVLDYYTGKSRHVKTLSGGESFKASLALALGLAEVVQSYAGGISLETMFVDEGFGTLDPESLDTAINCLIELQHSGRLVGIISHVPELKEGIDARLEIEAGKDGSRAQFFMR